MDSISNPSSLNLLVVERMLEAVRQQIDDIDELRIQAETTRYLVCFWIFFPHYYVANILHPLNAYTNVFT